MKQRTSEQTRRELLAAAARVIQNEGVAALTLDAVAREAGVSKGGLLYHFASKDALIEGMVAASLDMFDEDIARRHAEDAGPGGWLRAYVASTFAPDTELAPATAGLTAAVAVNPALLQPVRERFEAWQARASSDGIAPAVAAVVRLATDGAWFADLLGLAPVKGVLREDVVAYLMELTRG